MEQYNVNHMRIDAHSFQHPVDRAIVEKIQGMQAFSKALQFISKNSIEKMLGGLYRSSMAQVTPQASPVLFAMLKEAAGLFGVSVMPDIFLVRDYSMMALLAGIEKPIILFSTELLKNLPEDVLWGLIASEMSGIANGFCQIKFVEWMCNSSMGIFPDVITQPLAVAFQNWHKYAQYSFDRAALIATGNFNTAMQIMLAGEAPRETLAALEFDNPGCAYMGQCREFLEDDGRLIKIAKNCNAVFSNTSYYASRYLELFQFYQSEYYDLVEEYWD